MVSLLAVPGRLARPERVRPDADTACRRKRRRRSVAETPGRERDPELDRDRPDPEESGQLVEPETGVGATSLADRRVAAEVRDDHGGLRRKRRSAVHDGGDFRRRRRGIVLGRRREVAGEGGELAGGGYGREASEREGQSGDSGERHRRREEKEREGRGREREVRRVLGDEESEEREKGEEREGFGLGMHRCWGLHFCGFLDLLSLQIKLNSGYKFSYCHGSYACSTVLLVRVLYTNF